MSETIKATRPRTGQEIEAWVVEVCGDLGLRVQDPDNDFFAIGGTSMTAMRLIALAEEQFGEESLTPDDLHEHSALRQIATSIGARRVGTGCPAT